MSDTARVTHLLFVTPRQTMANRPRTRSNSALDPNSTEYGIQVLMNTPDLYGEWLRNAKPAEYRDWQRVNRPEAYGDWLQLEKPNEYVEWMDKRRQEQATKRQAQIDDMRTKLIDEKDPERQAIIQKQIDAMEAQSGLNQEARNFFDDSNTDWWKYLYGVARSIFTLGSKPLQQEYTPIMQSEELDQERIKCE